MLCKNIYFLTVKWCLMNNMVIYSYIYFSDEIIIKKCVLFSRVPHYGWTRNAHS
jgi:hypothetical protein